MPNTVLITGASSGIGRATALYFQQNGWNVAATMRSPSGSGAASPDQAADLATLDRVICPSLDVTDPKSIEQAIAQTLEQFQRIDVVVNNAGYGLVGVFEACTPAQIERQFSVNVFGVMNVTRAILPHFRQQQSGILINVASIGGRLAFPLYSPYHGTKWAIEGFSESLRYELEPFNIRVKIIEPGPIKTDFYQRSMDIAQMSAYDAFVKPVLLKLNRAGETGSPPEATAQVIYTAATDGRNRLRYPAGGNAGALLLMRKLLPDRLFRLIVHKILID